jgi:hypothetical protein
VLILNFPTANRKKLSQHFQSGKVHVLENSMRSPVLTPTIHPNPDLPNIRQMSKIMRPYIENIVNVKGVGNCGYQVISRQMSMDEKNHILVRSSLVHELKTNKRDYMPIFGSEERFEYIMNCLHPPTNNARIAYIDMWLTLPDMGHIVATCYNRVVVQLISPERCICETFFQIRYAPPLNPHAHIMWLGLILNHFIQVLDRQDLFKDIISTEPKPP